MIDAAIVGLGFWGRRLVESVQGRSNTLRFTRAVVRRPEPVREFAANQGIALGDDFAAVLADPAIKLVVLATPHSLHTEQIIACAAAGKAVHCEKPLALKRSDVQRAVDACAKAGVRLGVGHDKRFWPSMVERISVLALGAARNCWSIHSAR